jgi:sugar lactone lactonase YvrE
MNKIYTLVLCFLSFAINAQNVETITGQINASGGVSVDQQGNIYVADFGIQLSNANGNTVYKITPDGTVSTFATGLQGASGNAFDTHGNLFQSNIAANKISKITPAGVVSDFVSANITNPVGLEFDTSGNLYVCNCGSNNIAKVTPSGVSSIFAFSCIFSCPNGITRGENDTMYVSNFSNSFVLKIAPNGAVNLHAVIPGARNGHLEYANGRLYVASHGSHQIHVVEPDGTVSPLAGTGNRGNADGPAATATLSVPNGIAASLTGDTLYFNCTIPSTVYPDVLNPSEVRMLTGAHVLSKVSTVPAVEITNVRVFPNPTNDVLNVDFEVKKSQSITIQFYSMDGKLLLQKPLGKRQGEQAETLNVSSLSSGQYLMVIIGEEFAVNKKVMVK